MWFIILKVLKKQPKFCVTAISDLSFVIIGYKAKDFK